MECIGKSCFRYFMRRHIQFFMCDRCDNHIAVFGGTINLDTRRGFIKLDNGHTVNLNVANGATIGGRVIAGLNCSMCNLLLGNTMVASGSPDDQNELGKYVLKLNNMQFWNGYEFRRARLEMELLAITTAIQQGNILP